VDIVDNVDRLFVKNKKIGKKMGQPNEISIFVAIKVVTIYKIM